MAVHLLVEYRDLARQARLIPLATDATWRTYWLPACAALGLQRVPDLGLFPLEGEDLPHALAAVVAELERLRDHLAPAEPDGSGTEAARVGRRLVLVIDDLRGALAEAAAVRRVG